MKFKSLILLVVSVFVLFSCDDGIKFDNPNDRNSDAYNPSDTEPDNDSDETDTISENDDESENPSETDDDEPVSDDSDSDSTPDDADSIDDSGDSEPDENNSDDDSADSVPDDDSDSTDPTPDESDSTPDEDADTDSGDSTPDEDADTDSGDSTPDQDADTDTTPTNPCNPNPCGGIANSTGVCTVSGTGYSCACNSGYFWNDDKCKRITLGNICTGQSKCYNNSSSITCPTSSSADFYGQDAQYAKEGYCYPQSFTVKTVSGQNIVVDNNTGLEWQQKIPEDSFTWDDAVSYCENLSYAGRNDWRVPSPQELLTIVDNSTYAPSIDNVYFPNTPSQHFWSSYTYISDTDNAWYVKFNYGSVGNYSPKTNNYYVRCVRGNELPEFTSSTSSINGNVIVIDSKTGLIWQKTYAGNKKWQEALNYCETLTYAGYTDWRLPNKNELASLVNYGEENPASDFPDMLSSYFWSSSTTVGGKSYAWYIYFNYGFMSDGSKSSIYNVRCVRSEKINDPCNPNPCNGLANSTKTCTQHNAFEYSCGCNSGYFWNGQKCAVLPECSATSGTPCKDSTSQLTWSPLASKDMTQPNALNYCENLVLYGFSDWHLPTIDELRTLIKNCLGTETNGACAISEKNGKLSGNDYSDNCSCEHMNNNGGYYSKIGDDDTISPWSSSIRSDDTERAWYVGFFAGKINNSEECLK